VNSDAIGVFDSGIGGLTVVKELKELLPNENIIYFGDTARVPYGTRSKETIIKYANQDINFLKNHKVKMIIAACGTVSSVLGANAPVKEIPFTGVLLPAVQTACGITRKGRIGVIATPATIRSGSYGRAIRTIKPDIFVAGSACPLFVPLVENGFFGKGNEVARLVAKQYLAPIIAENVDTLILGCTHYPLLEDIIADIMGEGVSLVSAGKEAAKHASAILTERELLNDGKEKGTCEFYVTDSPEMFAENAKIFLGYPIDGEVHKVDIDALQ
jgi:glutamate racemase